MIPDVFVRSAYNYDRDLASDESGLFCEDVSLAQQSMRDESDINTIVRRFGLSGQLPVGVRMPTYADFTGVTDFHTAMNAVAEASEAFERMPANVRARFHNSPGEFVDFCSDPNNAAEAASLGLVEAQVQAAALVAPSAPPALAGGVVAAPVAPKQGDQ